MTTTDSATPVPGDGDIKPLDNHATGVEIKPLGDIKPMDNHATGAPLTAPAAGPASEDVKAEIKAMDNHATGPRP
ncbi:hypothetical protein ACM614_16565 [Streptomyces sp. 12297]|uniref:hypothetical protein n=1 Tax=Streptomyces sp. NBC_00239 TaxID=2903640 RepID=UPI002E2D7ECB|nr:hypothetical protein [Streptomyces sp. NBC_00239]